MARSRAAFRKGHQTRRPGRPISAPLGESYRRQSASMANLDYWGLTRAAAQVVHSYDFFWHAKDPAWMAAASVDAFQGITGLPVLLVRRHPHYARTSVSNFISTRLGAGRCRRRGGSEICQQFFSKHFHPNNPLRELLGIWRHNWKRHEFAPPPGCCSFCSSRNRATTPIGSPRNGSMRPSLVFTNYFRRTNNGRHH